MTQSNTETKDATASEVEALVIPLITDSFEPEKLHVVFSNVEKGKNYMSDTKYVVQDEKTGNDVAELYYLGSNEWRFVIDNFPAQRKFYTTNMPYDTFEDFYLDLERIGLKLTAKPEAV